MFIGLNAEGGVSLYIVQTHNLYTINFSHKSERGRIRVDNYLKGLVRQ